MNGAAFSPEATSASSNLEKYESGNPVLQLLIARFHQRIVEQVRPLAPRTVLDVGCGEGFLSRVLLDAFPGVHLVGVDASPQAVERARSRCPDADFEVRRVDELASGARRFDLVVCSEVLEHIDDPPGGIEVLSRLAPHALLTVPWEPWFQIANFARGKYLRTWGNHPEHIHRWSMRGFRSLAEARFETLHVETLFPWTLYLGKSKANLR